MFKKKILIDDFNEENKRKSMIRFVTLVLDFSVGAKQKDIRPSRGIVMK